MTFAERLRALRQSKKLSRQDLADATGLSIHSIASYEKGRREPNSKALTILENFFQVSGAYLRGETEVREVEPIVKDTMSLEIEREKLPKKIQELSTLLETSKDAEMEVAYHLVDELIHVLTMENKSQRNAALSILQDMVANTVYFLDTCENSHRDSDPARRIEFAKGVVKTQIAQALSKGDIFLAK